MFVGQPHQTCGQKPPATHAYFASRKTLLASGERVLGVTKSIGPFSLRASAQFVVNGRNNAIKYQHRGRVPNDVPQWYIEKRLI